MKCLRGSSKHYWQRKSSPNFLWYLAWLRCNPKCMHFLALVTQSSLSLLPPSSPSSSRPSTPRGAVHPRGVLLMAVTGWILSGSDWGQKGQEEEQKEESGLLPFLFLPRENPASFWEGLSWCLPQIMVHGNANTSEFMFTVQGKQAA